MLKYIANESARYRTFVANRVAEIRDATELSQWNYVDSKSNPADDVTRSKTAQTFLYNKRWLQGQDVLWEEKQKWPVDCMPTSSLSQNDPEVKRSHTVNTICTMEETGTQKLMTFF